MIACVHAGSGCQHDDDDDDDEGDVRAATTPGDKQERLKLGCKALTTLNICCSVGCYPCLHCSPGLRDGS